MDREMSENRKSPSKFYKERRRKKCYKKWIDSMDAHTSDPSVTSYCTSEVMELVDDKDIASYAVALVVASARKGIVALCANVAQILKENAKLEQKVRYYLNKCCDPNDDLNFLNRDSVLSNSALKLIAKTPGKQRHSLQKICSGSNQSVHIDNRSVTLPSTDNLVQKQEHTIVTTAIVHTSVENHTLHDSSAVNHTEIAKKTTDLKHMAAVSMLEDSSTIGNSCWPKNAENGKLVHSAMQTEITLVNSLTQEVKMDLHQTAWPAKVEDVKLNDWTNGRENPRHEKNNICCDIQFDCDCKTAQYWKSNYIASCQCIEQLRKDVKVLQELKQPEFLLDTKNISSVHHVLPGLASQFGRVLRGGADNDGNLFGKVASETDANFDSMNRREVNSNQPWSAVLKKQQYIPILAPSPLFGCKCIQCETTLQMDRIKHGEAVEVFRLLYKGKPLLQLNDQVMIPGNCIGQISYIGHLDGTGMPSAVFVGLTLREPKGNTNGCHNYKKYFSCPMNYGVFLPINGILFIVSRAQCFNHDE